MEGIDVVMLQNDLEKLLLDFTKDCKDKSAMEFPEVQQAYSIRIINLCSKLMPEPEPGRDTEHIKYLSKLRDIKYLTLWSLIQKAHKIRELPAYKKKLTTCISIKDIKNYTGKFEGSNLEEMKVYYKEITGKDWE